jgi:hypothetical protein
MTNPDLREYIVSALANKQPFSFVQEALLQSGWTIEDIRQAMQEIKNEIKQSPSPLPSELPLELRNWNWGAFFFTWVWGIANNVWISLLVFLPFVVFLIPIYLGINGNRLAWKNRHFRSIEDFISIQRKWAIWGFVIFGLSILIFSLITAWTITKFQSFMPSSNSNAYPNTSTQNSAFAPSPTCTPSFSLITFDQAVNQMKKTS